MEEQQNAQNIPAAIEQPVEAKPQFNPFNALSAAEITALAGNFNKQWRSAHALDIALAQTEYQCTENDATFYAWLKSEAVSILDRNAVGDAVKYITNLLNGVAFPNSADVTLGLIEQSYNGIKVELRRTVGIRVRDFATGKWESNTAQAILSKVYAKLGVKEKDWMR